MATSPLSLSLSLSLPLLSFASLRLHAALHPISGSEEPVCGASHNRGCRGSRGPPSPNPLSLTPAPSTTLTLDQHLPDKITKEYCFHSGICVNCGGCFDPPPHRPPPSPPPSPGLSCVYLLNLKKVCLLESEDGFVGG